MVFPPAPIAASATGELRVCPECGVIAPTERTVCPLCNTGLGPGCPTVPLPLAGRAWARVECVVACPHCQHESPVSPQALGAPIGCVYCGQYQEIDLGWWDEALQLAHAAVDLSAPDVTGQNAELAPYNPFAWVGVREAALDLPGQVVASQSPVHLRVGPGSPLCPRCRAPVQITSQSIGRVVSRCTRCDDREAFSIPDVVRQRMPTLKALLAWPQDAAAAQGRIEPWWALFEGPSYMRPMVEQARADAERAEQERIAYEAWQREEAERQERERIERERREREERARREREERERREREERERKTREERERIEREEAERLARLRAEEEERLAREAAERAEQERLTREAFLRAEQERQAQLAREEAERQRLNRRGRNLAIVTVVLIALLVGAIELYLQLKK